MKKLITPLITLLVLLTTQINSVFAQSDGFWENPMTGTPPDATTSLEMGSNIMSTINFSVIAVLFIGVCLLLYSIYLFTTNRKFKRKDIKRRATRALNIGLFAVIFAVLAYSIVQFTLCCTLG